MDEEDSGIKKIVSSASDAVNAVVSQTSTSKIDELVDRFNPKSKQSSLDSIINYYYSFFESLKTQSPSIQVGTGGIVGFGNGYIIKKASKTIIMGVGGGILILAILQQNGYIHVRSKSLRRDIESAVDQTRTYLESAMSSDRRGGSLNSFVESWSPVVKKFINENSLFVSGAIGGFLIALSI